VWFYYCIGIGTTFGIANTSHIYYIFLVGLNSSFQVEKKQLKASEQADRALLDKSSLDISLVSEHDDDIKLAGLLKYKNIECQFSLFFSSFSLRN
jgi:hypothetical protein